MDDLIESHTQVQGGYLFRGQLIDLGISDTWIRHLCRQKLLERVRHGTYAHGPTWRNLTDAEKLAVATRSVLDKLGPAVVASHHSAAALHGFDLWNVDPGIVHVTRVDRHRGRREAGVVFHNGVLSDDDVSIVDERFATHPTRAAFESASIATVESGMVVVTSCLRGGTIGHTALMDLAESGYDHWLGGHRARLAIRLSSPRLESVGEVRSLHMMWKHGIPYPTLQHEIDGSRSDFAWLDFCHLGEFDGAIKYGRLNPNPDDPGAVLMAEKRREDRLRSAGFGMTRWTWEDLAPDRQVSTARQIKDGLARSRRLYAASRPG